MRGGDAGVEGKAGEPVECDAAFYFLRHGETDVVLRVAGLEVARGELVSVDGELGVRIREIAHGEPSD